MSKNNAHVADYEQYNGDKIQSKANSCPTSMGYITCNWT